MKPSYFANEDQASVTDLSAICGKRISPDDYPLATDIQSDVLIYDREVLDDAAITNKLAVLSELHKAFSDGPGVIVVRALYPQSYIVDRASQAFEAIMQEEAKTKVQADHFSRAGNNGRIWNALQKLAEASPEIFCEYYANTTLEMVCQAWLEPAWRMTSQVNQVRPGGEAQQAHRDYHLGFQQSAFAAEFPVPVQVMSQYLTLQGAVAHTDMPLESGPTRLLPWSHQYELGYLSYRRPEFIDYFNKNFIQLPLRKGDGLFFNPALFHAAGNNTTQDQIRTANLLQISSAFGVPMEEVNHEKMLKLLYPVMIKSTLNRQDLNALIAVAARGYSFPTNLDTDPPVGGLVPKTQQQLVRESLSSELSFEEFTRQLDEHTERRKA